MKKINILIVMILGIFKLFGIPILLDVNVSVRDSVEISWKIANPESGMQIKIECFNPKTKEIINLPANKIRGDIGEIESKEKCRVSIDKKIFPANLQDYVIFPELIYQNRIYYEMQLIKKGDYALPISKKIIEEISVNSFYIGKFEITNEQFASFVESDGYEIHKYWKINKKVMSNSEVGWHYQGTLSMHKPLDWTLDDEIPWKNAESNFRFGPITNIRWFEANAFANWMSCEIPTQNMIKAAFSLSKYDSSNLYQTINMDSLGTFPLQNVKGGVSEWLSIGVSPFKLSCSAGCNEMYFMSNNAKNIGEPFDILIKCPLYRNEAVGFRLVIPIQKTEKNAD